MSKVDKVDVTVKYTKHNYKTNEREFSHEIVREWQKNNYFCPYCGKQEVWNEAGPGDCDIGSEFICLACEKTCYLDNGCEGIADEQDRQRADQIKGAINAR